MSFFRGSLAVLAILMVLVVFAKTSEAIGYSFLTVAAEGGSDLSVIKNGPSSAAADSDVSFNITVTNFGPDDAPIVTLRDVIPAGLTFVSVQETSLPHLFTCTAPMPGTGDMCTARNYAAGASRDFTLILHVTGETPPGTTFTNIASVIVTSDSYPDPNAPPDPPLDPNDENNSSAASFTTLGAAEADLFAAKSGPSSALPNSDVPFEIVISNAGPAGAQNVSFTDTLPGNMTFVSMLQNSGPAFDCSSAPAPGSPGTVTCTLATMNASTSASFTLTAHIPAGSSGTEYLNQVLVSSTSSDPNSENNTGIATVTASAADVSITKAGPATATAGSTISWTVTAANAGPDTAVDVSFFDQLPSGTTFVLLTQDNGPAASNCSTPEPGQNGEVNCSFSSLASGNSAQFTLTANIAANLPNGSMINNTATIGSDNGDANTSNNSQTMTTTVTRPTNIFGTKTASGPLTPSSTVTYTIVLNNNGSIAQGDNPGNEFTDILPASLTLVSATATAGIATATVGTNTVTWNGSLAGGATVTITITATIKSTNAFGASISNQGTISYDADSNGTNEASRLTDDPSVGGAADPTSFTVAGQPAISIDDVSKAEGNSGTTNYTFNVTLSAASALTVKVDYATANGTATAPSDYTALSTTTLTFNPGDLTKTVTVVVNGDTTNEPDETFFVNLSGATNATISDNQGLGTILNDDTPLIQFSAATYVISEGASSTPEGFASLTVQVDRTGDLSGASTVHYATADLSGNNECTVTNGNASQRCDYLMLSGTLRFAAGEASKTFQNPIVNDGYVEGAELFTITLSNVTGGTLGPASLTTVTITDDDTVATDAAHNPYLSNSFFVRMHYVDFLEREPDTVGFNDWVGVLNGCGPQHGFLGAPATCDRANTSKGFFGSMEFIDRGFLVYRLYDLGLNRLPLYTEFNADSAQLRGFGLTTAEQQQNLINYLTELGSRTEFVNRYAGVATTGQATQLIQLLEMTAGVTLPATATTLTGQPPQYGRADLISKRSTGQFSVVETVKAFVEQKVVYDKYFPRGFVTMQYFAYLHRDPDAAGWNDWLDVLVNGRASQGVAPGDYNRLIFGFIYSTEYRKRFGQP